MSNIIQGTKTVVKFGDAIIADNGTASAEVDLQNGTLVGVFIPTGFLGTALTFTTTAVEGGTHVAIEKSDGNALSYTVEASKFYPIDPKDFYGVRFVKFVSGTSETAGPLTLTYAYRIVG